jgi:hypothetical protein
MRSSNCDQRKEHKWRLTSSAVSMEVFDTAQPPEVMERLNQIVSAAGLASFLARSSNRQVIALPPVLPSSIVGRISLKV